jgi:hypothetical protein
MPPLLRWPARLAAYGLLCGLDHGIWVAIQVLPGPVLMDLARRRPWQRVGIGHLPQIQQRWRPRIAWLLRVRCRRASLCSTCLSRSLSARLLLDAIGVPNELHLGMSLFSDGRKVPHAWLADPATGWCYTPGLTPGFGVPLTHF